MEYEATTLVLGLIPKWWLVKKHQPSRGGLEVECWSDNRLDCLGEFESRLVWRVNGLETEMSCCSSNSRTPGPFGGL